MARLAALMLLFAGGVACGKKGPPLPPLSNLPRAPESVTARLQGDQVQIRFRIPSATQSNVRPANLERVDIYALTGPTVPRDRFLKLATVVASVPVRPPVPEGEEPTPLEGDDDALAQGALAVVYETLTPEALQPVVLPEEKKKEVPRRRTETSIVVIRSPLVPPDVGARLEQAPTRHYVAVGVTRSGRKGLPSAVASVSLEPAPTAPAPPLVNVRESAVDLTWPPPPGLRRPVQRATLAARQPAGRLRPGPPQQRGRTAGPELVQPGLGDAGEFEDPEGDMDADDPDLDDPDLDDPAPSTFGDEDVVAADVDDGDAAANGTLTTPESLLAPDGAAGDAGALLPARPLHPWPSVVTGYHVYAVPPAPGETRPSPYSADALPELLTNRAILEPKYTDTKAKFGDERCYILRVAEVVGTSIRESAPSAPTCVKVADVFAPAAPRSLAAVAGDGTVSLIWEANTETDLAGYLVFRSDGEGKRVQLLTPEPLSETTFRDTKVRAGARYVYSVVAVDTAKPPNRSEPSNLVEVFAR